MTTATIQPSQLTGGQYNSTPLVLSDQQTAAVQVDAAGNIKVAIAAGGVDQDVNIAAVNGATTAAFNTGVVGASTLRVTLATDVNVPSNIAQVAGATVATGHGTAAGSLRVELPTDGTGVVGLNAGTNAIGKLAANSGVDIGDVDVTSVTLPTPSSSSALGIANVVSTALETGHVIKNAAGNLYGFTVTTTTAAGYVQIFNATSVPAAGAVTPVDAFYIPAFGSVSRDYNPPLVCSTGISIAFSASTTPFTKTDSATAFISAQAV